MTFNWSYSCWLPSLSWNSVLPGLGHCAPLALPSTLSFVASPPPSLSLPQATAPQRPLWVAQGFPICACSPAPCWAPAPRCGSWWLLSSCGSWCPWAISFFKDSGLNPVCATPSFLLLNPCLVRYLILPFLLSRAAVLACFIPGDCSAGVPA